MSKSVMTQYQPSVTEWFKAIGEIKEAEAFRKEDNHKADRLEILYKTIGLSYERPQRLSARDLTDKTPIFNKILKKRGNELCAIRLVPKREGLPKLRNRGLSIRQCYKTWYLKQKVNPDDYYAYICPHSDTLLWSSIFVINQEAIFGEIVKGMHSQLTHGDIKNTLYQYRYDFKKWQWSKQDSESKKQIKRIINLIRVSDKKKQNILKKQLQAKFSHNYLTGYFEITAWPNNQINYIDYNRFLPKYIPTPPPLTSFQQFNKNDIIRGIGASSGKVRGRVVIVSPSHLKKVNFAPHSILICDNTDVRYLPLMRLAGAIVTNRGGILSHAAIISRELKKPCVIGTKIATQVFKNGDLVEVEANKGVIKKL